MPCNTSNGREPKVGNAGSPLLADQDVRLDRYLGHKRGDTSFRKRSYPFQVSVDYTEVVHILQAIRDAGQLNNTSVGPLRGHQSSGNAQTQCGLHAGPSR